MQNIYPNQQKKAPQLFVRHKLYANSNGHPWLQELKDILIENLSNPQLSIPTIAADLFISERQLFRKVKELTGNTPNHFLQEIRLQEAYHLLLSGQYATVKEVAGAIGYKRVDYFSNLFENKYGQRPLTMLSSNY